MSKLHPTIERVTARIIDKSRDSRRRYLELIEREGERFPSREALSCANLAHGFAAALEDKQAIAARHGPNLGIVTAYNDMLSAHQPYGPYPAAMKLYGREVGATAQVAGGLRVLEVTLRTPAALDAIRAMRAFEGAIVGAGTVTNLRDFEAAMMRAVSLSFHQA